MKITIQGRAHAVRYLTDTGGNPVIPNPDSPAPDDPVDVALDADAFVPIASPSSTRRRRRLCSRNKSSRRSPSWASRS